MTLIQASLPLPPNFPPLNHRAVISAQWLIKEREEGLWVPKRQFHNLLTNYGITAHAAAPSGQYTPPIYLVLNSVYTTFNLATLAGVTSVQLNGDPTLTGDTQLVLSAGLSAQEVVTITGPATVVGGVSTFSLTAPTVNAHALGDPVVREVTTNDTMAVVTNELQYDPIYNANTRMAMSAAYSGGTGMNTMQFFFAGSALTNAFISHVGLTEQAAIGAMNANLHNYAPLGYNHNNTNDVEIDVNYALQIF
jgi:hypothetical protein